VAKSETDIPSLSKPNTCSFPAALQETAPDEAVGLRLWPCSANIPVFKHVATDARSVFRLTLGLRSLSVTLQGISRAT
jgi:hypothetical protein